MARKKVSDRKRSRPIEKRKKITIVTKNKIMVIFIVAILIISAIATIAITLSNNSKEEGSPYAVIDTTKGTIVVELFEDKAPITCENFIKLANDGFYDGLIFHRIKDNFMIQAGKSYPDGSQKVSPYGTIEFEGDGNHVDGAISMASTDAGVGGSAEFFICDGAQSSLDGNYAAFGAVTENIEVVRDIADEPHDESLEPTPEDPYRPGGGKPLNDITINSIVIEYR